MISFRFHVVSITAVFLAIAVGIVVGSTYVDRAIVENLESRIDTVSSNLDDRRRENDALEQELDHLESYVAASADFAVTNRLTDVPVLVVAPRGIDEEAAERIALLARRSGAVVPGIVWLESRWALAADEDRAALAALIGSDDGDGAAALQQQAWRAIVAELRVPEETPEGEVPAVSGQLLADLQSAAFLSVDALDDASVPLAGLAGGSPRVLLLTGADAVDELDAVVPTVLAAPAEGGLATVVADVYVEDSDGPSRGADLDANVPEELREQVVAVDHADLPEGQVAAVLALDAIADGVTGRFGYGDGADGVLPGWSPP